MTRNRWGQISRRAITHGWFESEDHVEVGGEAAAAVSEEISEGGVGGVAVGRVGEAVGEGGAVFHGGGDVELPRGAQGAPREHAVRQVGGQGSELVGTD